MENLVAKRKKTRIKVEAMSQFCETFVSVLIIGIIRGSDGTKKIPVDRELLSAWGTCRSAIVFLHFLLPFIKFGSYLVLVQSSCQHVFGISPRELAGTAYEVITRCKIVPISCFSIGLFHWVWRVQRKKESSGGSLISASRRSITYESRECFVFHFRF